MTLNEGSNPFNPGTGQLPPYLAGREKERAIIRENLARLNNGRAPAADILMYGPRGMGKTALLSWIEEEVNKGDSKDNAIRTKRVTPNQLKSPADMWSRLLPSDFRENLKLNKTNIKLLIVSATWKSGSPSNDFLESALIQECNKQPLVFLLDEAHTMDPDLCRGLLNLSQLVRGEAPFLLVLAGTPGLRAFLNSVNASFSERSTMLGIGRLSEEATAEAITKPLQEDGITIDPDALQRVVQDSQQYPYFIQQWGKELWDEAKKTNSTRLTAEQVEIVEPVLDRFKQRLYTKRRTKLSQKGLLPAAHLIAEAFQDTQRVSEGALGLLIQDLLPADKADDQHATSVLQALVGMDFVWRPPDTALYESGIPSLMTYVLNKQRELQPDTFHTSSKEKDTQTPAPGRRE